MLTSYDSNLYSCHFTHSRIVILEMDCYLVFNMQRHFHTGQKNSLSCRQIIDRHDSDVWCFRCRYRSWYQQPMSQECGKAIWMPPRNNCYKDGTIVGKLGDKVFTQGLIISEFLISRYLSWVIVRCHTHPCCICFKNGNITSIHAP